MNFFNYDSKLMQLLMFVGDLIILNLLTILCSIPIFTIGAAQAGLYSGIRTLLDPEDDGSAAKAFFKGLRTGFKDVTIAWNIFFVLQVVMVVCLFMLTGLQQSGFSAPVWVGIVALALTVLFQTPVSLFHARFACTARQLIRNSWFLTIAHPLRSVLCAVILWLPVVVLILDTYIFMMISIVLVMLYYGVAGLLIFSIMKKPFRTLIDHYNETHAPQSE